MNKLLIIILGLTLEIFYDIMYMCKVLLSFNSSYFIAPLPVKVAGQIFTFH